MRILSLFVLHLCIIIGVDYIENYFNIPVVPAEKLEVYLDRPIEFLLVTVVFAPIIEEFAFRYPLKNGRYLNHAFIVGIILLALSSSFWLMGGLVLINLYMFYIYAYKKQSKAPLNIVFGYLLIFVVLHIVNYDVQKLNESNYDVLTLQFLPQVLAGFILTYLRVQFSFLIAVVYHAVYNLALVLLSFI